MANIIIMKNVLLADTTRNKYPDIKRIKDKKGMYIYYQKPTAGKPEIKFDKASFFRIEEWHQQPPK